MTLPSLFRVRPSLATTLLVLLVLSRVEMCFAAEVTLAGKYSLQLPDGWKAPIQSKTELEGEGPGKAELWAGVFETDKPIEEVYADEIIAMNSQPGYKVIERGAVKHSSGSSAQLSRFQMGEGGSITGVAYSLRLAPKEVVMLVVRMPAETVKTVKSDIQAIFNSIKLAGAANGADESWVTTPAEKSSGDSRAKRDESATGSAAAWPCAVPPELAAAAKKVKLAAPKTLPGTAGSISFPSGWQNYGQNPSDNDTFIAHSTPELTMIIAVYGSTEDSAEKYVNSYDDTAGFEQGKPCPYRTADGTVGTAIRFETKAENDVQTHFVFGFAGKAGTGPAEFTLVDCMVFGKMKADAQALFEACLQSLKLPSASSR